MPLALDSNLALLLVVGQVDRRLIDGHKRLGSFTARDFDILIGMVASTDKIVTTPNVLTEVSNLASFGIVEPARTEITRSLKHLVEKFDERYVPSGEVTVAFAPEFARLGLTDAVWLSCLGKTTTLVTADLDLYLASLSRGLTALNFNHLRDRDTGS